MIQVFDHVLPDPLAYRQSALAHSFETVEVAPGVLFRGIALTGNPTLSTFIAEHFPSLEPTLTFFRRSPAGQLEPNYIHTDRDMGEWTAILYLNPQPPSGDGTIFWRHKATGALESKADEELCVWRDRSQWEPVEEVEARFGRIAVFPAARFHSRSLLENYGEGNEARLIQVMFGRGEVESWR